MWCALYGMCWCWHVAAGSGLGKREDGVALPIKVRLKRDGAGVRHLGALEIHGILHLIMYSLCMLCTCLLCICTCVYLCAHAFD